MTQKAVSIVRDSKGRILAEIYPSTEKKEPCFRYRIIGGNGEKMDSSSQGYGSVRDAHRGLMDLRERTSEIIFVYFR